MGYSDSAGYSVSQSDSSWQRVKPICSTAHLLFFYDLVTRSSVFILTETRKVQHLFGLTSSFLQINHKTFSDSQVGWRVWGEKCLNCSHTLMKSSRLWVTSTHYASAACTGSPCHLFWTRFVFSPPASTFEPPLSQSVHFVTPMAAFPLYLLQPTTAPLEGSRVLYRLLSHCSRLFPLSPQLCQMSTAWVSKPHSGKATTWSTFAPNTAITLIDTFFQRRIVGKKYILLTQHCSKKWAQLKIAKLFRVNPSQETEVILNAPGNIRHQHLWRMAHAYG